MRKWIAALLATVVLMAGAVPALAAQKWVLPYNATLSDGVLHLETLITSSLPENEKNFMREWIAIAQGKQEGKVFVASGSMYESQTANRGFYLRFIIIDSGAGTAVKYPFLHTGLTGRQLIFQNWNLPTSTTFSEYHVVDGVRPLTSFALSALLYANFTFDSSLNDLYVNSEYFSLKDDDGLFQPESPEPSEPEPSEPEVPVVPPSKPEVPAIKNEYIPYDTTRWNGFFDWVSSAIGSGTNTGLKIFAFLLSIIVVIRVVKKFTH